MKPTLRTTVAAVIAASLGVAAGMWWAKSSIVPASNRPVASAPAERKPLYWYDPMAPAQHFDKPGKSPYMDMELVPRYPDDADPGSSGIRIDPRLAQNLGIRLATVRRQTLSRAIDAPGIVDFNGRNIAVVQARAGGFVSRVYPHAPGDLVSQGAALVDLLIPEWAAAQQEFLALLSSNEPSLISAARQRLILTGMSSALISQVEGSGRTRPEITLASPIAGVLDTLDIRAGMTVSAGTTLATIKSIDPIWIEAAVPEAIAIGNLVGTDASIQNAAIPGRTFKGRIISLLPQANADTHTLRVRIEMPNHAGLWRPGMFAQVKLSGLPPHAALVVPTEAIIHTGTRDLVIVAQSGSQFEPTEVRIGSQDGDSTAIIDGVLEGQQVVASGQFLIDSEASLRGVETRMRPAVAQPPSHHLPGETP